MDGDDPDHLPTVAKDDSKMTTHEIKGTLLAERMRMLGRTFNALARHDEPTVEERRIMLHDSANSVLMGMKYDGSPAYWRYESTQRSSSMAPHMLVQGDDSPRLDAYVHDLVLQLVDKRNAYIHMIDPCHRFGDDHAGIREYADDAANMERMIGGLEKEMNSRFYSIAGVSNESGMPVPASALFLVICDVNVATSMFTTSNVARLEILLRVGRSAGIHVVVINPSPQPVRLRSEAMANIGLHVTIGYMHDSTDHNVMTIPRGDYGLMDNYGALTPIRLLGMECSASSSSKGRNATGNDNEPLNG